MPFAEINSSSLLPNVSPVRIHYREFGEGPPLLFLHGGWGYQIYPFDSQIARFSAKHRIIIPDRSGYGASMRIDDQPVDFHARAAEETLALIDALGIERPVLWGHSDGAVIAALIGLRRPAAVLALILEAFHFYRFKPGSRGFFETMNKDPDMLGERVAGTLAADHGADYWRKLIVINGEAWLRIADQRRGPLDDLYDGRLSELRVPAMFIHGGRDPRTEPDELDAVRRELREVPISIIDGAGHSPHSESAAAEECNRIAAGFLGGV